MHLTRLQTWAILTVTAAIFAFSLLHASWLADTPAGRPKLLANGGVALPVDAAGCIIDAQLGYGSAGVAADIQMLQSAAGSGAQAVNIPLEPSANPLTTPPIIARLFKSKCAPDNARPRALLAAAVPALSAAQMYVRVDNAADVPAVMAALPASANAVFYGKANAVAAVQKIRPNAANFAISRARECTADYKISGWTGRVPDTCKNGTMLVALNEVGYTLWGWPNRYLTRMQAAGTRVIIAQNIDGDKITGLTTVEQYGDIADSYNGTIWIDDIAALGPSLKR